MERTWEMNTGYTRDWMRKSILQNPDVLPSNGMITWGKPLLALHRDGEKNDTQHEDFCIYT